MKKQLLATFFGVTVVFNALAYLGPNDKMAKPTPTTKGANCSPATAKLYMEFNDVRALIEQGGSMFQNRAAGVASYEVPKGSGLHIIFAGALWMGGTDVNGQLKFVGGLFVSDDMIENINYFILCTTAHKTPTYREELWNVIMYKKTYLNNSFYLHA